MLLHCSPVCLPPQKLNSPPESENGDLNIIRAPVQSSWILSRVVRRWFRHDNNDCRLYYIFLKSRAYNRRQKRPFWTAVEPPYRWIIAFPFHRVFNFILNDWAVSFSLTFRKVALHGLITRSVLYWFIMHCYGLLPHVHR